MLGDLEVVRDGVAVPLGGPKPRALVGLLLAADGRTVGVEKIIDQLWGEAPPPKVLGALQGYVSKLRRQLEPERDPRAASHVLVTRPSGYALVVPPGTTDVAVFEDAFVAAQAHPDPAAAETRLVDGLAQWRGPAYAGLHDVPVLAAEAVRLGELRTAALEQLGALRVGRGAFDEAIADLQALVTEHPERERLWALLVVALYRSGRQGEALEALRRVRSHLAEELGIDPGSELRDLEAAVLRQDESGIAAVAPAVAVVPGRPGSGPAVPDAPTWALGLPFAGREAPWAAAAECLDRAAAGTGGPLLVVGEPGIGKSLFADAVVARARERGFTVGAGTWESEGCPPLWGWTQVLGDRAADLLAGMSDEDDTVAATYRTAERLVRELVGGGPACVVLDDVQWADTDSHRLLRRIADVAPTVALVLVVVCREPAVDASPATQATLAALARLGATRIELGGLEPDQIRDLVRRRTDVEISTSVAAAVHVRTAGNPFYVGELVRLLAEEGALGDERHPGWQRVPRGVRDTVRHRVSELGPEVGELLARAAVLGRVFDADVLAAAWPDGTAGPEAVWDRAVAAGFLVEDAPGRLRFSHGLVRDAVYADLASMTRRRLHHDAAGALERCRVGHLDENAASLAEHYRLAGPGHARSAWTYAERAAERSTGSGAHAEAARVLAGAAELQRSDTMATAAERERLHLAWGTALWRSGRVAEAWAPLRVAAELALERGDVPTAARDLLTLTRNVLWSWRTEHHADEDAVALWQRVLAGLDPDAVGLRARILAALSVEVMHDPPGGRCGPWVDEALDLARHDDDRTRIDVLQVVLNALRRPDLLPRRVAAADELVALCVRERDERALAVALCKRALNHSAYGRSEDAEADLRRALGLAEAHRLATAQFVIRLGLAVLSQARGEVEESAEHLRAAESVQATIAMAGAGITASVRVSERFAAGRLAPDDPDLGSAAGLHPSLRDLRPLALAASGRIDEARSLLGAWPEQPPLIWDYLWVTGTVVRAHLWARIGDLAAITDLRSQLTPYADRIADGAMAACFFGSVEHALALLDAAAGDRTASARHAEAALSLHERAAWPRWSELSRVLSAEVATPPG